MKLSKNFALHEFRCRDGSQVPDRYMPNAQTLAEQLQVLRDFVGMPVVVISGYRTPSHNEAVDGTDDSYHLTASAADIQIEGYDSPQIAEVLEGLIRIGAIRDGGIGIYESPSSHYDIGPAGRRWDWR